MASRVVQVHLRWGDMDAFGHINNVAFVRYLEDARTRFLAEVGLTPVVDGYYQIVAGHEIKYVGQLEFRPEPIDAEVWVEAIRNSSYVLGYELRDGDRPVVKATTQLVCYDFNEQKPVRIPPDLLTTLQSGLRD